MSFEEYDDCFIWRCDKCRHQAVFPPGNFWACVAELKARRWSFTRDDESRVWTHYCWKCRNAVEAEILNMVIPTTEERSERMSKFSPSEIYEAMNRDPLKLTETDKRIIIEYSLYMRAKLESGANPKKLHEQAEHLEIEPIPPRPVFKRRI